MKSQAWASGDARDAQATLEFSQMAGVKPMIETFPLDKAAEAYQLALSNKPRFRVVLKIV
jgi:D-arabinose 1-dehydrogenase-like Zn-dependent alcohol dehydrogenase